MHFRQSLSASLCAVSLIIGLQNALVAQTPELPSTPSIVPRHAWDRFGIGSWKLVRVYTETLGENGDVESVSIADTKTTLDRADEEGFVLRVEATVEVAGKRFMAEPKTIAYGDHGELQGQKVEVKKLGNGLLEICGHEYETNSRLRRIDAEKEAEI